MKLVLDFGNTLQKIAIFEETHLIAFKAYKDISLKQIQKFTYGFNIQSAIISSVIDYSDEINCFLKKSYNFIELTEKTPIPIHNKYATPSTLGQDRLSAVIACKSIYPKNNILVINAGTCLTFDFIDRNSNYFGGAISPGLTLRLKSLNTFTDKLPLITGLKKNTPLIGNTTEQSILSGVINGSIAEIEGIINQYKKKYPDLKVFLSGGDMKYFDKKFKNGIFAFPNIVLFGLNIILDFNVKN